MGMSQCPLSRIADRLDALDADIRVACPDGLVSERERGALLERIVEIAGLVTVQDVLDAYADSARRNGLDSDRTRRLLREYDEASTRLGWREIEGDGGPDDSGPVAAQRAA